MHPFRSEAKMASILGGRSSGPDVPPIPLGGSKREALALVLALVVILLLYASFWFQATR